MKQDDLSAIQEQIAALDERIRRLENLMDGSSKRKSGRKSKLSLTQKNEIIQKHNNNVSYSTLAKEYSVSRSTICNICKGHSHNSNITYIF